MIGVMEVAWLLLDVEGVAAVVVLERVHFEL